MHRLPNIRSLNILLVIGLLIDRPDSVEIIPFVILSELSYCGGRGGQVMGGGEEVNVCVNT